MPVSPIYMGKYAALASAACSNFERGKRVAPC
jgi:hypothetical protein